MLTKLIRPGIKSLSKGSPLSTNYKHTIYEDWFKFPENDIMIAMALAAPLGGLVVGVSMLCFNPDARIWKSERKDPLRGEGEMINPRSG